MDLTKNTSSGSLINAHQGGPRSDRDKGGGLEKVAIFYMKFSKWNIAFIKKLELF